LFIPGKIYAPFFQHKNESNESWYSTHAKTNSLF
jgi:hypothetical protein